MSIYNYDKEKVFHLISENEVKALEDDTELEDLVLAINEFQEELDFLKKLKEKRVKSIDERKKNIESKVEFLKGTISETLSQHNQKSRTFPGVGQVITRKVAGSYDIVDEDALISVLTKEKELDNASSLERKLDKKYITKLCTVWEKVGKLPDCVAKKEDKVSLTIKYDADFAEAPVKAKNSSDLLEAAAADISDSKMDDFDSW